MDFELSDEQQRYRESVVAFAKRELGGVGAGRADGFSRDAWERCARFGIFGLPVPEAYGGAGADPLTAAIALEALGYGCPNGGFIFSIGAQMWSCEMPIVRFGSDEQRERYLPGLCDGSLIGVQAMTEPDSGSDAFSLTTRADRDGDAFVLNGAKTFVTNGPIADLYVVFARTNPEKGWAGLSAFIVERSAAGLGVGPPLEKMGLSGSPMNELSFVDCRVPADAVLGPLGAGMAVFNASMEWERSLILAGAVGAMERQLEACVDLGRDRQRFGQPIGKFQAVSHRIADMRIRLETSRLLLYKSAWLLGRGKKAALEAAMAKTYISECFLRSSLDALQIHGASGYMAPSETEADVRDAVGSRIYSGTSEMQRNVVARLLGL